MIMIRMLTDFVLGPPHGLPKIVLRMNIVYIQNTEVINCSLFGHKTIIVKNTLLISYFVRTKRNKKCLSRTTDSVPNIFS